MLFWSSINVEIDKFPLKRKSSPLVPRNSGGESNYK